MADHEFDALRNYLQNNVYPVNYSEILKRSLRRKAKNFTILRDILYYKQHSGRLLRVLLPKEKNEVLNSIHKQAHGGHLGVNKTWKKIRERYYWKGSFDGVRNFIAACDQCQRKEVLKKAKVPLQPIPVTDTAFRQIGMDIVGPLVKTENGNRYLLVFTEYLTKWVEADAIPDKSAKTVLRSFIDFVCRHGTPSILITDQGREFCNELNDSFCKLIGVDHRVASPYHPQTGGQTERFNRTLCTMLMTLTNADQNDWDIQLPYVLFAYRTSEHKSTKCDPFSLVYGRKAVLPVELRIPIVSSNKDDISGTVPLKIRVDAFLKLKDSRRKASENIKKAQKKQKHYHDAGVKSNTYYAGDQVLLQNSRNLSRKGGKLNARWTGPYIIEKVLTHNTYRLKGRRAIVNGNKIRHYKSDKTTSLNCPSSSTKQKCNTNDKHLPPKKRKRTPDIPPEVTHHDNIPTSKNGDITPDDHIINIPTSKNVDDNDNRPTSKNYDITPDDHINIPTSKNDDITLDNLDNIPTLDNDNVAPDDDHDNSRPVSDSDVVYLNTKTSRKLFFPVDANWQLEKAAPFGINVKNFHKTHLKCEMDKAARPTKVVNMRGDGNCLFRALSYILFGVQNYHVVVRDYILNYMSMNKNLFEKIESRSFERYVEDTRMGEYGTWGSDIEIMAFATMSNTNVYVYSKYGRRKGLPHYEWLKYAPISNQFGDLVSERNIYLSNLCAHFEPVLDVDKKTYDAELKYTRTPYAPIKNHLARKYWDIVSDVTLNAALVDNYEDEAVMRSEGIMDVIYVSEFTDTHYDIEAVNHLKDDIDPNIFNLLCDMEHFPERIHQSNNEVLPSRGDCRLCLKLIDEEIPIAFVGPERRT
ncbi:uncharacterized protein [Antedon mediterranea]|uniref:uncharacterized protein n=1 Tax=Antedon mediterranea TaxID=105859 RepID=UPI003AF549BF